MKLLLDVSARALALLWAGFWAIFFIAESAEARSAPSIAWAWISLGVLFLLLALVPWRWEKTGAGLLIGSGILLGLGYVIWAPAHLTAGVRALTAAVFAVPPLLAGALFLLHRRAVLHHV